MPPILHCCKPDVVALYRSRPTYSLTCVVRVDIRLIIYRFDLSFYRLVLFIMLPFSSRTGPASILNAFECSFERSSFLPPNANHAKPSLQGQNRETAALEGRASEQGKRLDTLSTGVSAVQETVAKEKGENQVGERSEILTPIRPRATECKHFVLAYSRCGVVCASCGK